MLPPLLSYLLRHCLIGIAAGWTILAGLLATDVGGLGHLLWTSPHRTEALLLLIPFFAITFGSLGMGTAVMLLQEKRPEDRGGRFARLAGVLATLAAKPAPQHAGARRPRS